MHSQPLPQAAHERTAQERPASVVLDLGEIHALAARPPVLTASIYLPTHRAGSDKQQDHIRLKNLVHGARRMLTESAGEQRATAILAPALALLEAPGLWAHPRDGLALFCAESGARHLWLPVTMPELVVVAEHCHIKPLMPMLQGDGRFYLLELTQHGVHLHAGSRFGLQPIELPGAPASIEAALGVPAFEHHTEVRTLHGTGQGASMYFGTTGDEDAKERVKKYFRLIDASVCSLLHAERAPLVTAGVDYLLPLYWEVNRYSQVIQAGISGNPDLVATSTLHDRAWEIVAPHFNKAGDQARERYAQLRGSERASDDLALVLRAAFQGRIEDLFIASDTERWGSYDVLNDKVREHEPRWPDDDDLFNTALIQALATRTWTQVVPRSRVPGGGDLAAVFRY